MSDKNIDKDIENSIEIVKKMKRCSLTGGFDKQTERLKAIFTVTAYLETMRENKEDLYKELETYKKISEKLAEISRCVNVSDNECRKKTCEQCVLEWARKEVEKDETR